MHRTALAALLALAPGLAPGIAQALDFGPDAIDSARYEGGALPEGQSALAARLQWLLDRAHSSPGVIDGWKGEMTRSALEAFEASAGLPVDGQLDPEVWAALNGDQGQATMRYTISAADTEGLSDAPLPEDYAKLAELEKIGFTRVTERLAERFHMDEGFLEALNPGAKFTAGEEITVIAPPPNLDASVARIEVRKDSRRLAAFDAEGKMLANYPVAVGSTQTPSPEGTHEVVAVAVDPTYSYRPDENFTQGDNTEPLTLPPGPNGPVGSVWIDLSEPTYGLHGTASPDDLFRQQSHGCVRMTNWDARELAGVVSDGVTVVFK